MNEPYIYVASSWRNLHYPNIVKILRGVGAGAPLTSEPTMGIHDFREEDASFSWRDIDADWESWGRDEYRTNLRHPLADLGFGRDMDGLRRATACLLVGPCGRSAHLELGYAIGAGLSTAIYLPEDQEPELMYRMADHILIDVMELTEWAGQILDHPAIGKLL